MTFRLRFSTDIQRIPLGPFLDDTDGKTPKTALSIANTDIKLWFTGESAFIDKESGGATHMASGVYYADFSASDTSGMGPFVIFVHVAGALPVRVECVIIPRDLYDAENDPYGAPPVNVVQVQGSSQTAADLGGTLGAIAATLDAVALVSARLGTTLEPAPGSPDEYRFASDAMRPALSELRLQLDALSTDLETISGHLDTEIAAIKAKTDNLPADPASSSGIPTASAIADAVWDETLSGHATDGTAGAALADADARGAISTIRGTVGSSTSPSTTQFTPSSLGIAAASADQLKGRIIVFDNDTTSAALRGQATDVTASSNAALPLLTFSALSQAPASGDTFTIV